MNSLQRFMFEHAEIRGEIAHLDDTFITIINQRPYPAVIKKLLGEALISCLLLAGSIKFEGEISLQFQGDKRLPLLLIQCDNQLQLRGFANYQDALIDIDYSNAFLQGQMVLTITPFNQTKSYQSMLPIDSISMADNLMHYFAQSEQLSTRVWLTVGNKSAAGMLLQLMPGQDSLQRENFWEYATHLGQTVSAYELLTLDNETLLYRLYHETELRLYPARMVHFKCRCNLEKITHVVTLLGEDEAKKIVSEQESISIHCDFCNSHYTFDAIDIHLLFHKKSIV
jgi:molecular chaperone Hsp33